MMKMGITTLVILILSMRASALQLPSPPPPAQSTNDNFYVDPDTSPSGTVTSNMASQVRSLSFSLANIKGIPSNAPLGAYQFRKGQITLTRGINDVNQFHISVLHDNSMSSVLNGGTAEVTISTNASLLNRAQSDINTVFPDAFRDSLPTILILFTNNDIRASSTTQGQGSTFQLVIATDTQYTYGILQFVSVEQAAATRGDIAGVEIIVSGQDTGNITFPYTDNVSQATTLSNTGTNGMYVFDFNEVPPPPPPPCNCKRRLLLLACEALRQQNTNNIPSPCQSDLLD